MPEVAFRRAIGAQVDVAGVIREGTAGIADAGGAVAGEQLTGITEPQAEYATGRYELDGVPVRDDDLSGKSGSVSASQWPPIFARVEIRGSRCRCYKCWKYRQEFVEKMTRAGLIT